MKRLCSIILAVIIMFSIPACNLTAMAATAQEEQSIVEEQDCPYVCTNAEEVDDYSHVSFSLSTAEYGQTFEGNAGLSEFAERGCYITLTEAIENPVTINTRGYEINVTLKDNEGNANVYKLISGKNAVLSMEDKYSKNYYLYVITYDARNENNAQDSQYPYIECSDKRMVGSISLTTAQYGAFYDSDNGVTEWRNQTAGSLSEDIAKENPIIIDSHGSEVQVVFGFRKSFEKYIMRPGEKKIISVSEGALTLYAYIEIKEDLSVMQEEAECVNEDTMAEKAEIPDECKYPSGRKHYPAIDIAGHVGKVGSVTFNTKEHGAYFDLCYSSVLRGSWRDIGLFHDVGGYSSESVAASNPINIRSRGHKINILVDGEYSYTMEAGEASMLSGWHTYVYVVVS